MKLKASEILFELDYILESFLHVGCIAIGLHHIDFWNIIIILAHDNSFNNSCTINVGEYIDLVRNTILEDYYDNSPKLDKLEIRMSNIGDDRLVCIKHTYW